MNPLRGLFASIAASIYVPGCAACDALLGDGEAPPFCARCRASLTANEPACPRCAEPLAGATAVECARCRRAPPPQEATIAPWRYGQAIAVALRRLKLADRADVARALAPAVAPFVAVLAAPPAQIDCLVPVPLHWRRRLRRGYNHAELIAHAAAGSLPVVDALRRTRATRPQRGLDAPARAANVAGAFAASGSGRTLAGRRVLVVDDVTTTGATLAAACAAARDAGAAAVYAFAVARAE